MHLFEAIRAWGRILANLRQGRSELRELKTQWPCLPSASFKLLKELCVFELGYRVSRMEVLSQKSNRNIPSRYEFVVLITEYIG